MEEAMERIVMELIMNAGNARGKAIEAIKAARKKDFETADKKLDECSDELAKTHELQTGLIQNEINGGKTEISLLVVHAQDHLMNALTVRDLATEIVGLCKDK